MRKLLTFITVAATLLAGGCGKYNLGDGIISALDRMPVVYRPTIQQGNVVDQESISRLEPGMTKRQVRYLLGTPMLVDVFHQDRWDFVFTHGEGSTPEEIKRVAMFFEDDRLARLEGDLRPEPIDEQELEKKEVVVSVPDWEGEHKTIWRRAVDTLTFSD